MLRLEFGNELARPVMGTIFLVVEEGSFPRKFLKCPSIETYWYTFETIPSQSMHCSTCPRLQPIHGEI